MNGDGRIRLILSFVGAAPARSLEGANQSNLATDGTYVYYTNDTEILRIPK